MKTLLFLILLTGVGLTQSRGTVTDGGTIWTDSLGYTNLSETSDSILVIRTSFRYNWYRVLLEGNANSPVDSFYVQAGSVRYNELKVDVDTVWGSWLALKDSSWSDVNTMINNTVGKDYLIFAPMAQMLRFRLLNNRGNLVTRNVVITINAGK